MPLQFLHSGPYRFSRIFFRFWLATACLSALACPIAAGVVYCSDLTPVSATSGWSTVQKDLSIDKKPITLGGKIYPKGLGTHSPSDIVYDLGGKYVLFKADVGIDDATAGKGAAEFLVYADDSLLFKSGVMKGLATPKQISVSVAGRKKLKLTVTVGPDTYDMDDADWAGAQLVEKDPVGVRAMAEGSQPEGRAPEGGAVAAPRARDYPFGIGAADGSRNALGRLIHAIRP